MKYLSKVFTRYKACFVAASFFFPVMEAENLGEEVDSRQSNFSDLTPDEILQYLAIGYLTLYVNRNVEYKANLFKKIGQAFSIDGFVFHVDRSCKPQSLPQYELRNLMEEAGSPTLIIDADSMDPRYFSEAQVTTRIEAFMEALENLTHRAKRKFINNYAKT
jgi:benzoyl-CoA reductase/2-hydroxyglutaryl-CoA dehydratase subunit BcrC/BadD/HgdB